MDENVKQYCADLRNTIRKLELDLACRDATIQMACDRLEGQVEGHPPSPLNFLQRIDELREIEARLIVDNGRLKAELARLKSPMPRASGVMPSGDTCGGCGASIGQLHEPGCDVERCPRCGHQKISCDCIYEVCGMDPDTLESDHPEIYKDGPTDEMYAKWDAEWGPRRMPWTGLYPGVKECREYGFWARMLPGRTGWHPCKEGTPGASEDLNRLVMEGRWNVERQRFEMPGREGR